MTQAAKSSTLERNCLLNRDVNPSPTKMAVHGGLSASAAAGTTMPTAGDLMSRDSVQTLRDLVECSICFCRLDTATDPRALPCLHTFCRKCLVDYRKKTIPARSNRRTSSTSAPLLLPCPICRSEARLGAAGISGLPLNFLTCRISEVISDVMSRTQGGKDATGATTRTRDAEELKPQPRDVPTDDTTRLQPSAPPLDTPEVEERLHPSAPALEDITTSGQPSTPSPTETGTPTVPTVQMRHADDGRRRRALPRPSSDPIMVPASSPSVKPRMRFGPLSTSADEDSDDGYSGYSSLGRRNSRNRKQGRPSFMLGMMGLFFNATRS